MNDKTKAALIQLCKTVASGLICFLASMLGSKTGDSSITMVASAIAAVNLLA